MFVEAVSNYVPECTVTRQVFGFQHRRGERSVKYFFPLSLRGGLLFFFFFFLSFLSALSLFRETEVFALAGTGAESEKGIFQNQRRSRAAFLTLDTVIT